MSYVGRSAPGDHDYGNSDDDSPPAGSGPPPKRGHAKESAKDVEARKAQNRQAQREFRQRKQQYIKELEARVELQKSSRDEQVDTLRLGLRALLDENQKLRELLGSLAGFIGVGLGGVLHKIAVDLPEFEALITRHRNEHLLETIKEAKSRGDLGAGASSEGLTSSTTRPSAQDDTPLAGPSAKRPRRESEFATDPGPTSGFLPQLNVALPPLAQVFPPNFAKYSPSSSFLGGPSGSAPGEGPGPVVVPAMPSDDGIQKIFSMPSDNPKLQAVQLVAYHMRNKREQPNYHLPPSLRPSVTQASVPHSPFFDGIIFPSLRDRLILLRDQYDLPTLFGDLVEGLSIHDENDDILNPMNWELSESFIRKYWYVMDSEALEVANVWRKARGEATLSLRGIVPDGADVTGGALAR